MVVWSRQGHDARVTQAGVWDGAAGGKAAQVQPGRVERLRSALRLQRVQVLALLVVVVCIGLAAYGTPRQVAGSQLASALRAGDVRAITWDEGASFGLEMAGRGYTGQFYGQQPQQVLWVDAAGALHRTWIPWSPTSAATEVDLDATIAATARADGVAVPQLDGNGLQPWTQLGWPLILVELLSVLVLLWGPQPRRKTKWATFWTFGVPGGLGVAWWLLRDAPWSRAANALTEPVSNERGTMPEGHNRMGGGVAFFLIFLFVGSLLTGLVLGLAAHGEQNQPPAGSGTWVVVQSDGTKMTLHG